MYPEPVILDNPTIILGPSKIDGLPARMPMSLSYGSGSVQGRPGKFCLNNPSAIPPYALSNSMLAHNPVVIRWELGSLKRKKNELVIFSHCGWECWDCHPNMSSKIETTWDCWFFNNPNFSGIGVAIPVLQAEAC